MLKERKTPQTDFPYLDTPAGIIIPKGHMFHTTENLLQKYAGPLFEHYPVGKMLEKAAVWIESTDGIGIILSLVLLWWLPVIPAVILAFTLSLLWHFNISAVAGPGLSWMMKLISNDFFQLLIAIFPLSWFGMQGMYFHLLAGILLFVFFKFGWIRMLAEKLKERGTPEDAPGLNDKVLNMLITRYAIKEGITLPNVRKMESEMMAAMQKSQEQRKRWTKQSHKKEKT